MKKFLSIALSLVLVLSILLTGCGIKTDTKETEEAKGTDTPIVNTPQSPEEIPESAKRAVAEKLNLNAVKDSLTALTENKRFSTVANLAGCVISGGTSTSAVADIIPYEFINSINASADIDIEYNSTPMSARFALKNGIAYGNINDDEMYACITKGTLVTFSMNNETSEWTPKPVFTFVNPKLDASYTETTAVDYAAIAKAIIEQIVIPEFKPEYLTVKGEDFVISESYIAEILKANASLIIGEESTEEDITQFVEKSIQDYTAGGIQISFRANLIGITRIDFKTHNPENADEYFNLTVTMDETNTNRIEGVEVKYAADICGDIYESSFNMNIEYNYNGICGITADLSLYDDSASSYTNAEDTGNEVTDIELHQVTNIAVSLALSDKSASDKSASLSIVIKPCKMYTPTDDSDTYTAEELNEAEKGISFEIKYLEDFQIGFEFTANEGKLPIISATGNLYLKEARYFPESIPEIVTALATDAVVDAE